MRTYQYAYTDTGPMEIIPLRVPQRRIRILPILLTFLATAFCALWILSAIEAMDYRRALRTAKADVLIDVQFHLDHECWNQYRKSVYDLQTYDNCIAAVGRLLRKLKRE
ncbi:MAG: hypothetical protein UY63_C0001G0060 [Parcubacteria group bacterium GW2011_GWA2_51_10]|nr:MAG: hypothetical protein UY63_C0001G0060 [Parcubacteria group bacterium GW2011_GWA2_51_10]